MADTTPATTSYSADPNLYLYTSLTAGSSHIITATSRLETILKAHRIPFRALDVATDEKARMLWGRRSKGKKLPGLVQYGFIVGDLEEIEEWNEYGELKERLGVSPTPAPTLNTIAPSQMAATTAATTTDTGPAPLESKPTPAVTRDVADPNDKTTTASPKKEETPLTMAMRQAGLEAAKKAGERKASQTSKLAQGKSNDGSEIPTSATTTDAASLVEEPNISAETTAAKVPEKLAEEGARRSSVDKIAEEEVKRTSSGEEADGTQEADGSTPVGMSTAAAKLELRRASSVVKSKSSLAEETTAPTDPSLEEADSEPTSVTNKATSAVEASSKEIRESEEQIEAVEGYVEASGEPVSKAAEENQAIEKSTVVDISVTDAGEVPGSKEVETQKQDATEPKAAGISVGD